MAMQMTTLQDRITIVDLSQAGQSDRKISDQVGWKLPTVRKWRRRGQRQGRLGLQSQMGRPFKGASSSYPPSIGETLKTWRQAHPGWGPKTLCTELEQFSLTSQLLPSRATVGRWLKEQGFTRRYDRHQELPQTSSVSIRSSHEEWEMDARGYQKVAGVGVVALINLTDSFSRAKLISYPCWLGEKRASRHPLTADYQLVLRLAFSQWGLPDRLGVDRGSVFHDNTSKSPFPTQLHLWLLSLGVSLSFGRPNCPKDQAIAERSHQTWYHQVLEGQEFKGWEALLNSLQKRQDFLNYHLPCASLGEIPPLVAHPEARTPRRPYRPEWEADSLDIGRVCGYLSQGRWFRKGSNVGTVSLGGEVYVLGRTWARDEVEITFDSTDRHLLFRAQDGDRTKRLPIRGITPTDLMGEMGPLAHLNQFQLALPFSWDEWRVIRLCESLGATT